MAKISISSLYTNYVEKYGERAELFKLLLQQYKIKSAMYPGCALHLTPSFFYPLVVYIDTYSKAKNFFRKKGLIDFVSKHKVYENVPIIRFYPIDFRKKIDEPNNHFDLLISQYAGFVSKYCKLYLKIGGILVVNNSHGDASMASIDKGYEFCGILNYRNKKYYYSQKNLTQYFIPKKEVKITEKYLEKIQRGIGYKKSASLYLFNRVN